MNKLLLVLSLHHAIFIFFMPKAINHIILSHKNKKDGKKKSPNICLVLFNLLWTFSSPLNIISFMLQDVEVGCSWIVFFGLDINVYLIYDFAECKLSIQCNLWIDDIQPQSNSYICIFGADLIQFISNSLFYRLVHG